MGRWKPIPGETPIDDISGLKVKGLKTRRQLAVAEAENVRKAIVKYLSSRPSRLRARFDLTWCFKLHREMFGDIWKWAGKPRQTDLNLGQPWYQIETALQSLLDDLAHWEQHWPDLLEQAAHLHHRSVQIHPFINGNGRWSRLLANIWLRLHDQPITIWPDATEDESGAVSVIRQEYLAALRRADQGKMAPLIVLHRRFSEPSQTDECV